ncbi:protein-L-isoaspartate(D-aspartate) O-methyltransferase [Nocardiopsis mwathae]|uniref:Protein-L-isoaspartate O-methyltransferase n=1 Tax=Nocardiopsis mwathae TaxID=1472723 RepID=A0A7W9YL52_9ACTN|nr:methyltransferase domain-containing protein [Nocardiopsis mwathae]MBB6174190.1 protein-L-isoaspartate(D-aspartate) O-methyltransferase [Nocardiopsis mwathae]
MTDTDTPWQARAAALASHLADNGTVTGKQWRRAFEDVPRHLFVPGHPVAAAYGDEALAVQYKPARTPSGDEIRLPTASASQPSVVAAMLDRLEAGDGMRVLEVGTGTGYNAALLCHRLGDELVASIDISPDLVDTARRTLSGLGYRPALHAADGHAGWADHAPYDRIVATCAVSHIPPAWIRQLAEGGRIVAPLLGDENALLVLDKTAADEVTGRVDIYPAAFMPMRERADTPLAPGQHLAASGSRIPYYGTSRLNPARLADADPDLLLFCHLHVPGLRVGTVERAHGAVLVATSASSRAEVPFTGKDDQTWATVQHGPYRIWDVIEHAVARWDSLGRPCRTRFGITALDDADRQYMWLDSPDGQYAWPLPL